jgi:lipopolysaccharide transport system permease protein
MSGYRALGVATREASDAAAGPGGVHVDPVPRTIVAIPGLLWTLVRTDFKARYHGTLSGFAWALLKPLTMFAVLTAVFSLIFGDDRTYKLDLILGLFLWDFFSDGTKTGLTSLQAKSFLLARARFPSWILVLTSLSNALLTVVVFAVAMIAMLATTSGVAAGSVALFALYLLALAAVIAGFSLGASVLFLRFRDLNQIWEVVVQAGFFVAPIVYPLRVIPEQFHFYLYVWPPTAIIEFSRAAVIDGVPPSGLAHACLAAMTLAVLTCGIVVYRKGAPRAAEHV